MASTTLSNKSNSDQFTDLNLGFSKKKNIKDQLVKIFLFLAAAVSVFVVFVQIYYLVSESIPAFTFDEGAITLKGFLFGTEWDPETFGTDGEYGAAPIILGSILTTLLALIFAVPLGIAAAVYISEIAPPKIRRILKNLVEILAGIPSIVFGAFGAKLLTTWVRIGFGINSGFNWFSASCILALMALPTIISVSEDALNTVPNDYREAALGMGSTKWQIISKIVLPAASPGIATAIILGLARAIGETMAVIMVAGNNASIPDPITDVFAPIRTITTTLGLEIGDAERGFAHYHVLMALVVVLFFIIIVLNLVSEKVLTRLKKQFTGKGLVVQDGRILSKEQKKHLKSFMQMMGKIALGASLLLLAKSWWGWQGMIIILLGYIGLTQAYQHMSIETQQKSMFAVITGVMMFIIVIIVVIVGFVFYKGFLYLFHPGFFTDKPSRGGIGPAIVGTFYLIILSVLMAVPLGILAGIYLAEYAKESPLTRLIRTAIDILNGTPSVVFGIFGFAVFVKIWGWSISLKGGAITLALMILPTIIRTTENAIRSVSNELREGSLALGASKWQTIYRVVLKSAAPGILTGTILAIGRAAGETAPILFTATMMTADYPTSLDDPIMALPTTVYFMLQQYPGGESMGFGAAVLLIFIVIGFYSIAFVLRKKSQQSLKTVFMY